MKLDAAEVRGRERNLGDPFKPTIERVEALAQSLIEAVGGAEAADRRAQDLVVQDVVAQLIEAAIGDNLEMGATELAVFSSDSDLIDFTVVIQ